MVLRDRFLLGLTAGGSSGRTDATYIVDDTPGTSTSEIESDSFTLAPYFAMIFNENFYADLHVGVSFINNNTFSFGGGFFSRADHDSFSYFVGGNANYVTVIEGFEVIAFAGFSFSDVDPDSYTNDALPASDIGFNASESTSNTRLSFGAQVAYPIDALTPYVQAVAEVDVEPVSRGGTLPLVGSPDPKPVEDEFGLRLIVGTDATITDTVIGSIEFGAVAFRTDYVEYFATANARFIF